jgi:hypothetical protein
MTSWKRIRQEISAIEDDSDAKVSPSAYYVVKITYRPREGSDLSKLALIKKLLVERESVDGPLVIYSEISTADVILHILFPPKTQEIYLKGSYQAICSEYASTVALLTGGPVLVNVTELDSQTKVLVFFQTKIVSSMIRSAMVNGSKLTEAQLQDLTFAEQAATVPTWESLPPDRRFGSFYRLDAISSKLKSLSELFDVNDLGKYSKYIFGSSGRSP